MKTEVKGVESYKKQLIVEVTNDEIQPVLEKTFSKYQKKININGFRKGKVPISIIKKRFGKAVESDAIDDLVQLFYKKAIDAEQILPVAPGKILNVDYQEGQSLVFSAEIEVEPEITVKDYRNIKIEKELIPVTDEDIDAMLRYLQEQHADRIEAEGGAEKGFLLEADIQVLDTTGFPIVGQKWEKRIIELGLPPFGPEIEDQLLGVKVGDTRRIRIIMPEQNQPGKKLQDQHYSITIHHVYKKVLPQLDNDFAKSLGEYDTIDRLKEQLNENLEAQRSKDSETAVRQKLSQEIVKRNDYTPPPAQIEHLLDSMFEEEQKRTKSSVDKDQFLQHHRSSVIWSIKWDRIWHKIAEQESIQITDEAVETEIDRMAQSNPEQEKRIRAQFKGNQAKNRIREHLLEEQVFELLKSEAKIKEVIIKSDKKRKSSLIT